MQWHFEPMSIATDGEILTCMASKNYRQPNYRLFTTQLRSFYWWPAALSYRRRPASSLFTSRDGAKCQKTSNIYTVVTWPPRAAETCAVSRLRRHLRPVTKTEVVLPRLQTRERERLVRSGLQVAGDGPDAVSTRPARRRLRPMGRRPLRQETN